jgi:phospholipid/cholesterol/gamma-HCH transport system substrate-binding protein
VVSQLVSLKLSDTSAPKTALPFGRKAPVLLAVPPDLRMQLGSAGITGVKFISLDFFDMKDDPPPILPFPPGENYIPAAPSMMKSLEDSLVKAVNRFPEIADQLLGVVSAANHVLSAVDRERLPEQASATLARAGEVLTALQTTMKQANLGKISDDTLAMIGGLKHAIDNLDAMLTKMDGEAGLLASAQRATDSIGDLAGGAKGVGTELSETLRGVREAADSIQRLTDALDTDSDMLLKGRAKGRP